MTNEFFFPGEELIEESKENTRVIDTKADVKSSHVFKPIEYSESFNVVSAMMAGNDVIVDLEALLSNPDKKLEGQRFMDYICGASQALNYSVQKVNIYTFILNK